MRTVDVRRAALSLAAGFWLAASGGAPAAAQAKKTANFDMAIVQSGSAGQVTVNVKLWVTPTSARAEVRHPLQGESLMLVSDGFVYQLNPAAKQGVKAPLPPELKNSKDNFQALLSLFAFDASKALKLTKKVRTEQMAGYLCDVYSNTIKEGPASRSITIWMPQKMDPKMPVKALKQDKVVKEGANLSETTTVSLSNIKLNVPMAPGVFKVPAGYKIQTAKAPPAPPKK